MYHFMLRLYPNHYIYEYKLCYNDVEILNQIT